MDEIRKIYVKNMVCPRCIATVQKIMRDLEIEAKSVELGEVIVDKELNPAQKELLEGKLIDSGFELLTDHKSKIIGQIKSIVVHQIHHDPNPLNTNFSTLLSAKLNLEYTSLSKLFSSVEGLTIERYILKQKIEKVKELLFYDQLTLSEIAFQLSYSSTAHLSAQFKKETGMTPSAFKKMRQPHRKHLDEL